MFGPLGVPEIIAILVLALLIFGPRRLPEMGRTIGKALGEFRRATTELKRSINTEIALEDDEDRPRYSRSGRQDGGEGKPARRSLENPDDEFVVTTEGLIAPRETGGAGAAVAGNPEGSGAASDGEASPASPARPAADGAPGEPSESGGESAVEAPVSQPGTVARKGAGGSGPDASPKAEGPAQKRTRTGAGDASGDGASETGGDGEDGEDRVARTADDRSTATDREPTA